MLADQTKSDQKNIRNQDNCEQYITDENFCIFSDCMWYLCTNVCYFLLHSLCGIPNSTTVLYFYSERATRKRRSTCSWLFYSVLLALWHHSLVYQYHANLAFRACVGTTPWPFLLPENADFHSIWTQLYTVNTLQCVNSRKTTCLTLTSQEILIVLH